MSNSTISGNSANRVGAIYANGGVLYLNQITIANNSAVEGTSPSPVGGLQVDSNFHVSNSIISNNDGIDCNDASVSLATNVNNFIGDGSCSPLNSGDPLLGPLQNNGGLTPTHDLLGGSQAFGAGDPNYCPATDQRGVKRPDGSYCDLGAIESAIVVTTLADNETDDSFCSLREALWAAHTNVAYRGCSAGSADVDDSILFAGSILPGTINLSSSSITIQTSLGILGPGAERLTVSANGSSRIFWINDGNTETLQNISINRLTLSGGSSAFGGAIRNYDENLSIESCVFSGNVGTNDGAAIFSNAPCPLITRSLVVIRQAGDWRL